MYNLKTNNQTNVYSIVGNNGMAVTTSDATILEALHSFVYATVTEFPSVEAAVQYAYSAYYSRFMMRNYNRGIIPLVPRELPLDYIFIDPDYATREGEKPAQVPFPGLPV